MYKKSLFIVLAFIIGVVSTLMVSSYFEPVNPSTSQTTTYIVANSKTVRDEAAQNEPIVARLLGLTNEEKPSPYNYIREDQIIVDKDKITIKLKNAQWSRFTDTKSMDPVIDKGANAIQIVPEDESDVHVGDIVSYKSLYADGTIIHRVIEIGYDNEGWYAILKGDNNSQKDPGRVRFNQIKRITVAIIY